MISKILRMGTLLGALLLGSSAHAVSTANCAYTSPLRSRDAAGRLVPAWSVIPGGGRSAQVATAANGVIVLLLETSASVWEERPLYWPTPNDPNYDYRKMKKLPTDTKFIGNDEDQSIRMVPYDIDLPINGVSTHYSALNYNGHYMVIDGCGGQDNIYGGIGSDHIYDYAGTTQLLSGDKGRDWIEGAGAFISGGDGDDCITGVGFNTITVGGDDGNDVISVLSAGSVWGGRGRDTCGRGTQMECEVSSTTAQSCEGWL